MSDFRLPRYPGGPDPGSSQRELHQEVERSFSWVPVATVLIVAVVLMYYLILLTVHLVPMPVLI